MLEPGSKGGMETRWLGEGRQCRRLGLPVEPDEEETGVYCTAGACMARGLLRGRPTVERGWQHRWARVVLGSIPGCLPGLRPRGIFPFFPSPPFSFLPPPITIFFIICSSPGHHPSPCMRSQARLVLVKACTRSEYAMCVDWRLSSVTQENVVQCSGSKLLTRHLVVFGLSRHAQNEPTVVCSQTLEEPSVCVCASKCPWLAPFFSSVLIRKHVLTPGEGSWTCKPREL